MTKQEKRFKFEWGGGYIAEQAQVQGEGRTPALQLLRFDEGEAAGEVSIRFCQYGRSGRFSRTPLMMTPTEIDQMRVALKSAPELRRLIARLVE